ncbi:hypothetical protein BJ166DRAFT_592820 [Pestalotiopsis sp. NC0098]|nr:hypothetical protein BJ166DRAFT_592820 [Pestalotiopsis sp. NC0098]
MDAQSLQERKRRTAPNSLFHTTYKNNDAAKVRKDCETRQEARSSLSNLPAEIHLLISKQLIYPDALSLKHTSRYFHSLVDTGIELKVTWLMERRSLHLECPNDRRCDLGSDLKFCRGSVRLLMQRRREHMECESRPGLGCLVFGTQICVNKPQMRSIWARWLRAQLTIEAWWVLLAIMPVVLAWFYVIDLLR